MPRKKRRRQYFVQVRFQVKYIAYILLFLYLGAIIAGYTVYWTTWVTLGEKLATVYPRGRLVYIFRNANWVLFWRLLLITPVFVLVGTFLSHRIAGPVYRISRYVDFLRKGKYDSILSLRKRDELKGLARRVDKLRMKLQKDRQTRVEILDSLEAKLNTATCGEEVLENIRKLKDMA